MVFTAPGGETATVRRSDITANDDTEPYAYALPAALLQNIRATLAQPAFNVVGVTVTISDGSTTPGTGAIYAPGPRSYSPNLVRVLIDYVMAEPNIFGPGLAESDIDWPKMFAAAEIAGVVYQGPGADDTREFTPGLQDRFGVGFGTYGGYLSNLGLQGNSGYVGSDQPDEIMRYEYNGQVGSDQNYPDAIEDIISPAPGAIAYWGRNGKFAVSLPDATRTEADQAGTNVIDDKILLAPVEIVYPDSSSKLNQLQVTFPDANEDYAESSIVFPADNSVLHNQLLAEDGGVLLHRSISLDGIDNRYAATAAAYNVIMQSRRERYRARCKPIAYLYEHGDVFRLIDPIQVIDVFARVTDTLVTEFLEIGIEAIRFDKDDYAWITDDMQTVDTAAAIPDNQTPPNALNSTLPIDIGVRIVQLDWLTSSDQLATTVGYEIEVNARDHGSPFRSGDWEALAAAPEETRTHRYPIPDTAHLYRHRIRGLTSNGQRTDWRNSSDLTVFVAPPLSDFAMAYDDIRPPIPDIAGGYAFRRWDVAASYENPTWAQIRDLAVAPADPAPNVGDGTSVSFNVVDADGTNRLADHRRLGFSSIFVYYVSDGQWCAWRVVSARISQNELRCTVELGSRIAYEERESTAAPGDQRVYLRFTESVVTFPPRTDFVLYYDDIRPPIPNAAGQYAFRRWDRPMAYDNPTWAEIRDLTDPPLDPTPGADDTTDSNTVAFYVVDADGTNQLTQHARIGAGSIFVYYVSDGQWVAWECLGAQLSNNQVRCSVELGARIAVEQSGSTAAPGDQRVEHRFTEA